MAISEKRYFFGVRGDSLVNAVSFCSGSAFLLVGYDQGVFGGLLSDPDFIQALGHPSSGTLGTITATYDLGCCLGGLLAMIWGEPVGRRRSTIVGLSIMVVGAILQCSTYSQAQVIVGRVISGVGNGINCATIPMWNSEMTKPHNRGRLNSYSGSMIGFGIFFSYWFEYGMAYTSGPIRWRLPIAFQLVFALTALVTATLLPESPRWLIAHGKPDEAVHVLASLESKTATADTPEVVARREDIEIALKAEHAAGPVQWKELWVSSDIKNRKRVLLACGIMVFQQMSGVNALVYYIPFLLQNSVGIDVHTSLLIAGLVGLVFFLFSFYAIFFIDRWGRRWPFIITSILQSLSMAMVSILLSLRSPTASKASVAFFFTYMAVFATCYLGTPWSYSPELLPLRLRARGAAVATAVNWACTFIIVEITPFAITNIGWKTYVIFAVLNFTWAPLLYFFYPETARKSMEEIDNLFLDKKIDYQAGHVLERSEIDSGLVSEIREDFAEKDC